MVTNSDAAREGGSVTQEGSRLDQIDLAELEWSGDVPEHDALIYAVSTRILRVSGMVEASFEEESQRMGFNSGEALVLDALRRLGPPYEASPAELKAHFFISFAGIGKRLTRLEQLGLIERRQNEDDRRAQIIRLTEAGLETLRQSGPGHEGVHTAALRSLPIEQLRALSQTLKDIQQGISEERALAGRR